MFKSYKVIKDAEGKVQSIVGFFNISDGVWVTPIHISFSRSRKTETHLYNLDESKSYLKVTYNGKNVKVVKIVANVITKATKEDLQKITNKIDKEVYLGKTPDILLMKLKETEVII